MMDSLKNMFGGKGHAEAEQCFKDTMAAWKANIP